MTEFPIETEPSWLAHWSEFRLWPFRRGAALTWPAALLIATLISMPLLCWWVTCFPYIAYLGTNREQAQAIFYFGPPLVAGFVWRSGKVWLIMALLPFLLLLAQNLWLALRFQLADGGLL